jgi:hypothetical protein
MRRRSASQGIGSAATRVAEIDGAGAGANRYTDSQNEKYALI